MGVVRNDSLGDLGESMTLISDGGGFEKCQFVSMLRLNILMYIPNSFLLVNTSQQKTSHSDN